jgi:hypothetical protein
MTEDKKRRVATAVGFLSGVIACVDTLRDLAVWWPPSTVWAALHGPQRLEFGGGVALIVVTLIVWIVKSGSGSAV